jgi:hypothetical protein
VEFEFQSSEPETGLGGDQPRSQLGHRTPNPGALARGCGLTSDGTSGELEMQRRAVAVKIGGAPALGSYCPPLGTKRPHGAPGMEPLGTEKGRWKTIVLRVPTWSSAEAGGLESPLGTGEGLAWVTACLPCPCATSNSDLIHLGLGSGPLLPWRLPRQK